MRHLTAAAALALLADCALAGISIEPVVIQLAQANRAATIRITNHGEQGLHLQAAVFRWSQAGADRREPSDELLVVPPIVEIAPGASQLLRVALRRRQPVPREQAYRLLLQDIGPAASGAVENQVRMPLSHDLPVLVAPAGPAVRAITWAGCGPSGDAAPATTPPGPCLRLANQGSRRVKFDALTLSGPHGDRRVALPTPLNLLAGSFLDLPLPADAPAPPATRTVLVHATEGEPVAAQAAPAP